MHQLCGILVLLCGITATRFFATATGANEQDYKVVCYLASWAAYRTGDGKFTMDDIDTSLCSHLVYAFADIGRDSKIAAYDPNLDLEDNRGMGSYKKFTALKKKNKNLKTLLSVGGWKLGSLKFSAVAKYPNNRFNFIQSCVSFLNKYGFDGLDVAWLYPANNGGAPEDKANFIILLQDLKRAFEPHNLLLSIAVGAGQKIADTAYNVPEIAKYSDFINVMTYDYHGDWESKTGHGTPLFPRPFESEEDKKLNVDSTIRYWLDKGAPSEKLILGLAIYGRTFTLKNENVHGIGSPVEGKGKAGPITQQPGILGFNEICTHLSKETGWKVDFEKHQKVPYSYNKEQWVAYDDVQSISLKMDYIKKMKLGGGAVWTLDTDDFRGHCFGFPYPLISVVQEDLNGPIEQIIIEPELSTTETPTIPTPNPVFSTTTTKKDGTNFDCPREGYFRHPTDCKKFYYCLPHLDRFRVVHYNCGPGTVFDERIAACGFPNSVPECRPQRA